MGTKSKDKKKTSKHWEDSIPREFKPTVLDHDGWDRNNFNFSFYREKITREEFLRRLSLSTISGGSVDVFSKDCKI